MWKVLMYVVMGIILNNLPEPLKEGGNIGAIGCVIAMVGAMYEWWKEETCDGCNISKHTDVGMPFDPHTCGRKRRVRMEYYSDLWR